MPTLEYQVTTTFEQHYATWDEAVAEAIRVARDGYQAQWIFVVGDEGERIEIRREWLSLAKKK